MRKRFAVVLDLREMQVLYDWWFQKSSTDPILDAMIKTRLRDLAYHIREAVLSERMMPRVQF